MREPSYPFEEENMTRDRMMRLSFRRCGLVYHGRLSLGRTSASSAATVALVLVVTPIMLEVIEAGLNAEVCSLRNVLIHFEMKVETWLYIGLMLEV